MSTTLLLNNERKVEIFEDMLKKAERNFVCPACVKSFKQYCDLKIHIKQRKHNGDLEGLLEREESTFRRAYERSIGWKATEKEPILKLPRERNAAFTRDFVVRKIASQAKDSGASQSSNMLEHRCYIRDGIRVPRVCGYRSGLKGLDSIFIILLSVAGNEAHRFPFPFDKLSSKQPVTGNAHSCRPKRGQ